MNKYKILYLSCHAVLERDEVSLFHELGYQVFSPGAFVEPLNPGNNTLRPGISGLVYDQDILNQWNILAAKYPGQDTKDYLTKEFVDNFDCVIVMHLPRWIERNWEVIKHKRVIWRTIGQSISPVERQLSKYRKEGLQIVRYSPKEMGIPGFIGADAMIRFYKDPADYGPWTGTNNRIITFAQSMKQRDQACNFSLFEAVTAPFPRHLFGPGNDQLQVPWASGQIPFEKLQEEMRLNRCYFYTGTHPASYTLNFMEALMSGMPIVAIGPEWGNAKYFPNHDLYEIPDLIQNGVNGFVSNDSSELINNIHFLLNDHYFAQQISIQARKTAIALFGKEKISKEWQNFLERSS